jgi:hypothetical protein
MGAPDHTTSPSAKIAARRSAHPRPPQPASPVVTIAARPSAIEEGCADAGYTLPNSVTMSGGSLPRARADQAHQRHQGSDRNVFVINQLFLCERQGVHDSRASSWVFASIKKMTSLPSPREYHWQIFPSR